MPLLELFGGITYLFFGGDLLIRGAVSLARRVRISPMLVGLTLVAFGTSAPELVVSLRATLTGHAGIALGNIVGSNIANVLFVCGLPAIIYPMSCNQRSARRDGLMMLFVSVAFVAMCMMGPLGVRDGLVLLAGLVLFVGYSARVADKSRDAYDVEHIGSVALPRVLGLPSGGVQIAMFVLLGVLFLPIGAELTVHAAVEIAESLGVGEAVVGLTIVAIGTSLPELVTTVMAAIRKQSDVAVGNILGSNLLNLLAIGGAVAVTSPTPVQVEPFLGLDLWVMLGAAIVMSFFTWRGTYVGRRAGVLLVAGYGVYLFTRIAGV